MLQLRYRVQPRTSVASGQARKPAKLELWSADLRRYRSDLWITRALDSRNHSRQPADSIRKIRNCIEWRLDTSQLLTTSQDAFLPGLLTPGLDHRDNIIGTT